MAEYEAALIKERTTARLAAARARGRNSGRRPKMTPELTGKARASGLLREAASGAVPGNRAHRGSRPGRAAT